VKCKHKNQRVNEKRGERYCARCGLVLEDNIIDMRYSPEFGEDGQKESRTFKYPYLIIAGTNDGMRMITIVLSRRGRCHLRRKGILT